MIEALLHFLDSAEVEKPEAVQVEDSHQPGIHRPLKLLVVEVAVGLPPALADVEAPLHMLWPAPAGVVGLLRGLLSALAGVVDPLHRQLQQLTETVPVIADYVLPSADGALGEVLAIFALRLALLRRQT